MTRRDRGDLVVSLRRNVDACPVCTRHEGDLYYRRNDLQNVAHRLARKPTQKLADEASGIKAAIAETRRMYAEHVAAEHPERLADTA